MAVPNEGTTNLPSDASSRYFIGLWDGTNFRAWRSDTSGIGKVENQGKYTTFSTAAVSVATTSTTALAANSSRRWALLVNDSDTVIYLAIGAAALKNSGIRLNANGGSYEMSLALGNLNTGAIYAIHAGTSGTKTLLANEGV